MEDKNNPSPEAHGEDSHLGNHITPLLDTPYFLTELVHEFSVLRLEISWCQFPIQLFPLNATGTKYG